VEHDACVALSLDKASECSGEALRDMMDSAGQWEYVVEMVLRCALAMWPLYPGVFMIL
jgi:hypothetical protein